ncbi:BZ3500_MvSof-1268-A1-R1_Chr3-1g05782 [Microbotryum saponariae]|uniref:BZ3500_MvSof-1268-A1-R1_Chr3-1g05782 protein n=1 Tax=Microbotryum saponariae TaxID=289078 RepID=A0A2X0L2I6_9BASI|nr:BZ3500_MvSof-1268-A1-R1_Chr3-1g05782 [Microbotryum saponariae]SDA04972.1 BZ3501_MvSof-1269-A2-R1_Chr3-1g05452 [Microbotryum saponariae]
MVLTNRTCPAENTSALEQSDFWDGRWDAHEIGWLIAGVAAAVSTVVTLISVFFHARNYYVPREQRQIIRILFMPAVYSIISFCSYRWFRDYTYYQLIVVIYESIVLAAFLMLLLQYIGDSTDEQREALLEKEKKKLMVPFCCWRYRPSKPYFLHALKWSTFRVLADSIFRPIISITGIICQALSVLCPTQYSIYYASVYLDSFDFISISVALYGLILFYGLVKERLAGKKPLAKFLAIKGIVMITFYQVFIFSVLQSHGVIKATEYWTAANVADGLAALCTCCEMVIFSAVFLWAFSWKPYKEARAPGQPHTSVFKALLHSFNYADFFRAGWHGIVFTIDFILGRPGTRSSSIGKKEKPGFDIDNAFQASSKRTRGTDGASRSGRDDGSHSMSMGEKGVENMPFVSAENREGAYGNEAAYRESDHHVVPMRQDSLPPSAGQRGGRTVRKTTLPLSPASQQHQQQQNPNQAGLNQRGYVEYQQADRDQYGVAL